MRPGSRAISQRPRSTGEACASFHCGLPARGQRLVGLRYTPATYPGPIAAGRFRAPDARGSLRSVPALDLGRQRRDRRPGDHGNACEKLAERAPLGRTLPAPACILIDLPVVHPSLLAAISDAPIMRLPALCHNAAAITPSGAPAPKATFVRGGLNFCGDRAFKRGGAGPLWRGPPLFLAMSELLQTLWRKVRRWIR